jgi:hypothetical protein
VLEAIFSLKRVLGGALSLLGCAEGLLHDMVRFPGPSWATQVGAQILVWWPGKGVCGALWLLGCAAEVHRASPHHTVGLPLHSLQSAARCAASTKLVGMKGAC